MGLKGRWRGGKLGLLKSQDVPTCHCSVLSIKIGSGHGLPGGHWNFVMFILTALSFCLSALGELFRAHPSPGLAEMILIAAIVGTA